MDSEHCNNYSSTVYENASHDSIYNEYKFTYAQMVNNEIRKHMIGLINGLPNFDVTLATTNSTIIPRFCPTPDCNQRFYYKVSGFNIQKHIFDFALLENVSNLLCLFYRMK